MPLWKLLKNVSKIVRACGKCQVTQLFTTCLVKGDRRFKIGKGPGSLYIYALVCMIPRALDVFGRNVSVNGDGIFSRAILFQTD